MHYEIFVQEGPVQARYKETFKTADAAEYYAKHTTDGKYWVYRVDDSGETEVARGSGEPLLSQRGKEVPVGTIMLRARKMDQGAKK